MTQYTKFFMDTVGLPEGAKKEMYALEDKLDSNPTWRGKMTALVKYFNFTDSKDIDYLLQPMEQLAGEVGFHPFTVYFYFYILTSEALRETYRKKGLDEQLFWDSMDDLRCKLIECHDVYGIWGTHVARWHDGFFNLSRIALGRFQFEFSSFGADSYNKGGVSLERGDRVVNFHIPSSGVPLIDEVRYASYKKAFDYFKDSFGGGPVVLVCSSWLLYNEHYDFLPKHLNILKFMDDFDIIISNDSEKFGDAWRVFGSKWQDSAETLPRDTSLRRAFADRLCAGKKTGHGYGVIVFDGEKIINKV